MKSYKKAASWTLLVGGLTFFVWGSMNSQVLNKSAFMQNKYNIKFAKRLDEMNGELVSGRMAASLDSSKWSKISTKSIKKTVEKLAKPTKEVAAVVETPVADPAITGELDLTLAGGLYNKKPLKDKSAFYGNARVANGVIEEIRVGLPGGVELEIHTSNERLNGNVFTYEDAGTGELRSGLLYKVKEGVYMVTLTNDSIYPGLRLEFKTDAVIEQSFEKQNESWAYNEATEKGNVEQAQNVNESQDGFNDNSESAENVDETQEGSFQFNFQV